MKHQREDGVFSSAEWKEIARQLKLSPRQTAIVHLLFEGCTDKDIARRMSVKPSTIRTHLARLCEKLGVNGRAEIIIAVMHAFRGGCDTTVCGWPIRRGQQGKVRD